MYIKIIIGTIIALYLGYLIVRQVRNMKAGNYCGSCSGCSSVNRCSIKKAKKDLNQPNPNLHEPL